MCVRSIQRARRLLASWLGGACALLGCVVAHADADAGDHGRWVVRHFSSTEGLPVSSASSSAIDGDGFLWLATHDGLARFDGREFSVYDAARFREMGSNRVNAVYADGYGGIYALGAQGEWLRVVSSAVQRVRLAEAAPPTVERVRFVQTEPLCITLGHGLFCASAQGMRLRRSFASDLTVHLAVADGPRDWLLTAEQGVLLCEAQTCVPRGQLPLPVQLDAELHAQASEDRLLLGLSDGLLEVPAQAELPARWLLRENGRTLNVMQVRREGPDEVMLGSGRGLFRVSAGQHVLLSQYDRIALSWRAPDGALWRSELGDLYREQDLVLRSRGQITSLLFAADGSIFVTTLRDGMYTLAAPRLELLGVDPMLRDGNLYGLALERSGIAWLGSLGDGLFQMDVDGRSRRYSVADGLPGDNIWAVAVAPDQQVYAGSYLPGLWLLNPGTQRFGPVKLPEPLASAQIRAFAFDRSQQLWVGGAAGAWQRTASGWQQRWPLGESAMVLAIIHTEAGVVWYGSEQGLWRQDSKQSWPVAARLLDGAGVRGLFEASDGAIWAASAGRGLIRVAADDLRGERAQGFGRAEGLPSNSPHSLIEDRQGDLWVNSNQGIFRIRREDLEAFLAGRQRILSPLVLGLADGLTDLEGNGGVQPASAIDGVGRIWFPTQRGVVRFDPLELPLRRQAPRAVIDSLDHEGQRLELGEGVLPIGVRAVQLSYNAADLRTGREVRFRHRLIPGEREWTEAGTRRVAAFASLAPGAYRFEVLAGNSDGYWAQTPVSVAFQVQAYWYERRGYQLLLVGLAALGLLYLAQWRIGQLRRRTALLDQQVQLRTRELVGEKQRVERTLTELAQAHEALALTHEQIAQRNRKLADQTTRLQAQEQFRSRLLADVSHELRTPLMLIRLPLQEVIESSSELSERDRRRLDLPYKQTERLSHLVEQLLGLVQAEGGQLRLQLQRLELVDWCKRLLAGFQPVAQRQQVRLLLQAECPMVQLYADPVHLTTIIGNLLDNALKFAPSGSDVQLRIQLQPEQELVCVRVIDAGVGFAAAVSDALFERFYRVPGPPKAGREGLGIGLALARELTELHGGCIGAEMVDGVGTVFWLELPLGSAHVQLDELLLEQSPTLPATTSESSGGGILLIEDHPELSSYLQQRLAEFYPVAVVVDAESGIERLLSGDIQLLISDVVLPGMDGVALCRQLKSSDQFSALPIILISAKATSGDRQDGLDAGAVAWLSKPFAFADLLEEIGRCWRKPTPMIESETPSAIDPVPLDGMLQLALELLPHSEFGVAQWAERCHLSDRQLRRRVTELTGLSPLIWLREQRLLRIRSLLSNGTCQTLIEAGAQVGLCNPGYLYRLYRARFGE